MIFNSIVIKYIYFITKSYISEFYQNFFGLNRICESDCRLDGEYVVITGANKGLGKRTAYELSRRGANIIIGCRDLEKGMEAINDIKLNNCISDFKMFKLDLSSLTSVHRFAHKLREYFTKIDILVNNAGIILCPECETQDGFEMQLGTNHLGHFFLTILLLPLLEMSCRPKIINVSSRSYYFGKIHLENINLRNRAYGRFQAYAQSKLAIILFTRELAKRFGPQSNINVYALHPGIFENDLERQPLFFSKFIYFIFENFFY